MNGMNRCEFIGNLVAKPELKISDSGVYFGKMRIACNMNEWNKDEKKAEKSVHFQQIKIFGALAKNCNKYLDKGALVHVLGFNKYEDYNERDWVHAREIRFLKSAEQMGALDVSDDSASRSVVPD